MSRQELCSTGGNCQGDDRQESYSSAGNCQADGYSPLDRRQRKRVLDITTRELLTPKGLRTLSPNSYGYIPWYLGTPEERQTAYYAGSARPWLMDFYSKAYIRVFGLNSISFIERMMIGFDITDEIFGISIAREGDIPPLYVYGAMAVAIPP